MNEGKPRRDAMLAQASYTARRDEATRASALPGRGLISRESLEVAPETQPSVVVAGPRRHTIAPGETFASIARRYYGTDRLGESLREYNRGRISRGALRPGELLVVPPRDDLPSRGGWVVQAPARPVVAEPARIAREPEARSGRADDADDAVRRGTGFVEAERRRPLRSSARPAPRLRAIYHVVGTDETPRTIARDRLGDPARAAEIVNLNHDLLTSEGRWKPGLRILLPPDAD
jgi:hypothetical protein